MPPVTFDFDTPSDRTGTSSVKWDYYRDAPEVIQLWVADMDFPAPPPVVEALRHRADHGIFGYTLPSAELLDTVVAMLAEEHDWRIDPDWLVWLPGLVPGINAACRIAGEPGDGVLLPTPIYPPFRKAITNANRRQQSAPTVFREGRWRLDMEALERALTPRTKLLLFCNPHNPLGRVYDEAELAAVADLCRRHDLLLLSDEVHCGLVLDPDRRHLSIAAWHPEIAARTITLLAPSKTYNLPGLNLGFAVIPDRATRRAFVHALDGICPHPGTLAYAGALAAYRDGEPWRRAVVGYLRGNRDLLAETVATWPGVGMAPVEGTYLAWLDLRDLPWEDSCARFLAGGVRLWAGEDFGGPGFGRLNFAVPRARLQEALRRMSRVLETVP